MKKICCIALLILVVLGGCGAPLTDNGMIDPGEKVGAYTFSKGNDKDTTYLLDLDCVDEDENTSTCYAITDTKINISWGIFDPGHKAGRDLESVWAEHTYEMLIDGRPVNLDKFGFIDAYHMNDFNNAIKMRFWNVWISSSEPVEVVIKNKVVFPDETYDTVLTLIFKEP